MAEEDCPHMDVPARPDGSCPVCQPRPAVARQDQGAEDGERCDCLNPYCSHRTAADRDARLTDLRGHMVDGIREAQLRERLEALADAFADTAHRHQHAAPGSYDAGMRRGYSVAADELRAALRPGGAG